MISEATLELLVQKVLVPSLEVMELKGYDFGISPLDEVKVRLARRRNIDRVLLFHEKYGAELARVLSQKLGELKQKRIVVSDLELTVAAYTAAREFAFSTERYQRVQAPAKAPTPKVITARRVPAPVVAPRTSFVGEHEPTTKDRTYYGNMLYATLAVLLATNKDVRSQLYCSKIRQPNLSNAQAVQEELRLELQRYQPFEAGLEDRKMVLGVCAVNSLARMAESCAETIPYSSFHDLVMGFQEVIQRAVGEVGVRLQASDLEQVLNLYRPRMERQIVADSSAIVVLSEPRRRLLQSPPTSRGPYGGRTQTQLGPYSPEPVIILTDKMRKDNRTVGDPVFVAAMNLRLEPEVTREVCGYAAQLQQMGIPYTKFDDIIERCREYDTAVREIADANFQHNPELSMENAMIQAREQLKPTELAEYVELYGAENGPKLLDLVDSMTGKASVMGGLTLVTQRLQRG